MMSLNSRMRDVFAQPDSIYAKPVVRRIVLGLVCFLLLMIILSADFIPDKISVSVGEVSSRDVVAPRTISYIDASKTQKLEAEVLSSVANVYDLDMAVLIKAEENITGIFSAARTVVKEGANDTFERKVELLMKSLPVALSSTAVEGLAKLDEPGLVKAEEQTRTILRKYFQRGIRDDDLDFLRKHVVIETEDMMLGSSVEAVVAGISQTLLKPNFILNIRETDKRKQSALANVESVRVTVKKGQVLIRQGEVVSLEQIQAMEELGLLSGHVSEMRLFGLTLFVLLVMAIIIGYLYKFAFHILDNDLQLLLLSSIILVTLLIAKVFHYYSDFSPPIAAGALLTAILIDTRLSLVTSVVLSLLFGIIIDHDLRPVAVALIGSLAGVYSVSKLAHGYSLTRAGVLIAGVNFLVIGSTGFIEQVNATKILTQGMLGVVSGIGAAVVTTGLLPYLEHAFKITTPIKLLELAQPNHPLLQRLLLDAPGTYHHSVLVGNLAETAADVIGADLITVRVGAYYHDIGKIKRPYFFIENQVNGENPHDKIAPSLSTLIVTSHIKDGVDLCRDYNIPQVIVDIVAQHHGTTLASYFYKRATENEHGDCLIEADFRYEGPTPQSKEAALVMLADACEAAVRSIGNPNANRIEATVRKMIRERLHDGQLDECNLTLKDLTVIGDVFIRVLSSMFHKRIEYPETLRELERRKSQSGSHNKQCSAKHETIATNEGDSESGIKQGS